MTEDDGGRAVDAVRLLNETLAHLQTAPDLQEPLQSICEGITTLFGYRRVAAYLSLDDQMDLVAVAFGSGPRRLPGATSPVAQWERAIAGAESWGRLRFLRDGRAVAGKSRRRGSDATQTFGDEAHWGDLNMLVAPLESRTGRLIGAFTVEATAGMPLPDELVRGVLETAAVQAGFAVQQRGPEQYAGVDRALVTSEERFRLAFENAPIGMAEIIVDSGMVLVARVNRAAGRMVGVEPVDVQGRALDEVLPTASGTSLAERISAMVTHGNKGLHLETRFARIDGTTFWGRVEAALLPDALGRTGVLCQILDISSTKANEEELKRLAHYDPLTGLPNRAVLLDRLAEVVRLAHESGQFGGLFFCDLDHFKGVNDQFGHLAGDVALTELSRRLRSVVRRTDIVGRFGGDEFVVVAFPLGEPEAELLAQRLMHALASPIVVEEASEPMEVGGSVGVAMIDGGRSAVEVLGEADAAMYERRAQQRRNRLGTAG